MKARRRTRFIKATPADPERAEQLRAQVVTPPAAPVAGDGNPGLADEEPEALLGERLIEAVALAAAVSAEMLDEGGADEDVSDPPPADQLADAADED